MSETTLEIAEALEDGRIVFTLAAREEIAGLIRRLQAENEALRKDAERYQWLRDNCVDNEPMVEGYSYWVRSVHFEFSSKETLDAAIDEVK
jgi:hypothetical protein